MTDARTPTTYFRSQEEAQQAFDALHSRLDQLVARVQSLKEERARTKAHQEILEKFVVIKFKLFTKILIKIILMKTNNPLKDIELHILQIVLLNQMIVDTQFIKLLKAGLKLAKKAKHLVSFLQKVLGKKIVLSVLIEN